jgi:hypothetical protein
MFSRLAPAEALNGLGIKAFCDALLTRRRRERLLVHGSPTLFVRTEMGTIWRDEVQHGFPVLRV